ncbi:MAG: hypothetical protein ABIA59_03285 [Candidatus Latescibacterota bacterium]
MTSHSRRPPLATVLIISISFLMASCTMGGTEHVITLAKLHNLKATMGTMTQVALGSGDSFPKDPEAIVKFMVGECGFKEATSKEDHPFVDGWRQEMRLSGDWKGYIIRSSGPDKRFDTEDDMYVAGDYDSEYIIDGVKETNASARNLMTGSLKVPYQEPNGYYRVTLPGKYSPIPKHEGWRSETLFRYTKDNTVTIIADPGQGQWDPQAALDKRIQLIQAGRDDKFSAYQIIESNIVNISQAPGYEIVLKKDESTVHLYELVNRGSIQLSVSIVSTGKDRNYIMNTLTNAVEQTLSMRD